MVQHCEQEKRVWWLSLKKGKHIIVIWLIEQHKENDRSEKKWPNLYPRGHACQHEFSQRS